MGTATSWANVQAPSMDPFNSSLPSELVHNTRNQRHVGPSKSQLSFIETPNDKKFGRDIKRSVIGTS
jgi:hypothetical protein